MAQQLVAIAVFIILGGLLTLFNAGNTSSYRSSLVDILLIISAILCFNTPDLGAGVLATILYSNLVKAVWGYEFDNQIELSDMLYKIVIVGLFIACSLLSLPIYSLIS